jgi:hypothetical protein
MFSLTVSWSRKGSWKTRPTCRSRSSGEISRTSTPPTATVPEVASQNRGISRAIVDLPDPEAPTRAHTVPSGTSKETSVRASRGWSSSGW